jgi:two-component system, NarL family, sensor histidine kinase UhpB
MQKCKLLLPAFLFLQVSYAQQFNTDSLLSVLPNAKPDTNKVNLLRNIGVSLAHKDPQKAIEYWKQGVQLSRELGYDLGLARSFINIGTGYTFTGKYDSAAAYTDSAIIFSQKINDKNRLALSYLNRADIYRNLIDYKNALLYCDTALTYAEQTGNTDRLARIYDIRSDIYAIQLQFPPAIANLDKALEFYTKDENTIMVGQVYSDFADIYKSMQQPDSAISYYKKAIKIGEEVEDFKNLSTYHADLGDLYISTGNYKEAEVHILRSLEYAREQENKLQLATAYARLANLYLDQHKYADAIQAGKSGYQYALEENHIGHQQENAALLAAAYMGTQDHRNANKYLLISRDLNDSLLRQRFNEEIAGLQNTFEIKEKDKEILLLNTEKELQQQRLARQRVLITGSIVLVILALIGVILLIGRYRLRNRMKELELRNQIAADLHDEVGSSLSSIHMLSQIATQKNNAGGHSNELLLKVSNNARETMEKMSDIVWMIKPGDKEGSGLVQRIQRFMHEMCGEKEIEYTHDIADLEKARLDMKQRKNIYLVFKEALNNAVKYSGGTRISVKAKTENKNLELTIEDNGSGFTLNKHNKGNGLVNMNNRARELNGKLKISSDNGTRVQLVIPVTA